MRHPCGESEVGTSAPAKYRMATVAREMKPSGYTSHGLVIGLAVLVAASVVEHSDSDSEQLR